MFDQSIDQNIFPSVLGTARCVLLPSAVGLGQQNASSCSQHLGEIFWSFDFSDIKKLYTIQLYVNQPPYLSTPGFHCSEIKLCRRQFNVIHTGRMGWPAVFVPSVSKQVTVILLFQWPVTYMAVKCLKSKIQNNEY